MRVLVVEDEPDLLRVLAQALREDGYAVDEAADGKTALYKATTWDYDAILLDVMLPGMDGLIVLKEVRRTRRIPVLLLTARDAIQDRIRGLDAGADDYVVKPFNLGEVLARVRAVIRRASGKADSTIDLGSGVIIDTAKKTVTSGGSPVVLTAREYAILELLAHRRGEVVTKTMIYDHIFDEHEDTASNLVEVHVSNLRKKLGKDVIETRRGLGYVIDHEDSQTT
ncbi:MAG: response regulator transcription factor [Gemmataceae bacterium]